MLVNFTLSEMPNMIKASNQWGVVEGLLPIDLMRMLFVAAGYSLLACKNQQEYKIFF